MQSTCAFLFLFDDIDDDESDNQSVNDTTHTRTNTLSVLSKFIFVSENAAKPSVLFACSWSDAIVGFQWIFVQLAISCRKTTDSTLRSISGSQRYSKQGRRREDLLCRLSWGWIDRWGRSSHATYGWRRWSGPSKGWSKNARRVRNSGMSRRKMRQELLTICSTILFIQPTLMVSSSCPVFW